MQGSSFQTSGGRRPVYALRAAPRQAAAHPDLSEKKLQIEIEIEIEIGIEEKWPAEMRESISIAISISIPTKGDSPRNRERKRVYARRTITAGAIHNSTFIIDLPSSPRPSADS